MTSQEHCGVFNKPSPKQTCIPRGATGMQRWPSSASGSSSVELAGHCGRAELGAALQKARLQWKSSSILDMAQLPYMATHNVDHGIRMICPMPAASPPVHCCRPDQMQKCRMLASQPFFISRATAELPCCPLLNIATEIRRFVRRHLPALMCTNAGLKQMQCW